MRIAGGPCVTPQIQPRRFWNLAPPFQCLTTRRQSMHTSKTISRTGLALVASLSLVLGLTVALKWTVKAQEPPDTASTEAWAQQEIGQGTGLSGDVRAEGAGVFSVTASGGDIWRTADSFRYGYQALNGNGQIVARVLGMEGTTNGWAKAGVMIRETLDPHSRQASAGGDGEQRRGVSVASGTRRGQREHAGGSQGAAPCWVKLVRYGNW